MTNYFLMSLAVADLLVCLIVMPFGAIIFFSGNIMNNIIIIIFQYFITTQVHGRCLRVGASFTRLVMSWLAQCPSFT